MNTLPLHFPRRESKGAALIIVLAFVVLLTGLVVAYLSRTTTDRQLAKSSSDDTAADLLARSAIDIVVSGFKQERANAPATPSSADIQPQRYGIPAPGGTPIPNLIRRSFQGDPTGRTSTLSSTAVSANGRSISLARWNSHYLVPRASTSLTIDSTPVSSFVAPDWVLVTAQGPLAAPAPGDVLGRYAYAAYDEGGLLDMNLAGFPTYTSGGGGGNPNPSPTPWYVNLARKGIVAFADLSALPSTPPAILATTTPGSMGGFPSPSPINKLIGWRNFATTQQPDFDIAAAAPTPSFKLGTNDAIADRFADYFLFFGEPPFPPVSPPTPAPVPFTTVSTTSFSGRTDQAVMSRLELLKLQRSIGFSQSLLQYLGTFSREQNASAPIWPLIGNKLREGRFNLTNLDLVKPNPLSGVSPGKGKGQGKSKGRGHLKGLAGDIVNLFGLAWIPSSLDPVTSKWKPGYWRYIDHLGKDPTNPNALAHIPKFKGPGQQNDFFQILDYALYRVDFVNTGDYDLAHLLKTFSLGASLIDQYDSDPDDLDITLDTSLPPNKAAETHTTVIEYAPNTFAYGMETGDLPYDPGPAPSPSPHRPAAAPTPAAGTIVLNHAFTNVGEFGYGIITSVPGLPTLDVYTAASTDAPVLDFFSYNPVASAYPRAGIVNLNTRNAPVLAALIKGAVPTETAAQAAPSPTPVVNQSQAMTAAQAIVAATSASGGAALTRADVARLASVAGSAVGASEEQKETITRALAEVTQTRTWNLMIDVIAQTGRYAPSAANITGPFAVAGEKRYWLHIAIDRYTGQVIGQQLEEVTE